MNRDEDNDFDLRFKVVETGFSERDDEIHDAAIQHIFKALEAGKRWESIIQSLEMADQELKRIIIDDFLKITLAQRHFQGRQSVKQIAKSLGVPANVMIKAKESMLQEVKQASIDAYHLTKQAG